MSYSAPPAHLSANNFTPASVKQINYIKAMSKFKDLGAQAEWTAGVIALADEGKMDKRFASRLIGKLKELPNAPVEAAEHVKDIVTEYAEQTLWEVPAGRYALVNDKADEQDLNPILFYRVRVGKEGTKWEGRRFITRIVGGGHDFDIKGAQATRIIRKIHGDIIGSSRRYGREFKVCGRCGRDLTQRLSRELGIGPVCADHLGIDAHIIDATKHVLIAQGFDPEETIA